MKVTVTEVLEEGNWSAVSWSPRIADEDGFAAFIGALIERASAYVEWRVGSSAYDDPAEPQNSVLKDAEMHLSQEQMLLSAAEVADSARDAGDPPFLGASSELRLQAGYRRRRAEELLRPFSVLPPATFARPAVRTGLGALPVEEYFFDEFPGRVPGLC